MSKAKIETYCWNPATELKASESQDAQDQIAGQVTDHKAGSCGPAINIIDNPDDRNRNLYEREGSNLNEFSHSGELHILEKVLEDSSCGVSYHARFQRLGDVHDLEKAIKYSSRALDSTPDGHPDLPRRLHGLGCLLARFASGRVLPRFVSSRALDSLLWPPLAGRLVVWGVLPCPIWRLGACCLEASLLSCTRFAPVAPACRLPRGLGCLTMPVSRLGDVHASRNFFSRLVPSLAPPPGAPVAIKYLSRALDSTPDGHPDLPGRLDGLGVSYHARFQRLGDVHDLEKAIKYKSRALDSTPDGHPDLSRRHFNLAISFLFQYRHTKELSNLDQSLTSFRKASDLSAGPPRDNFRYSLTWARYASSHPQLSCMEAYQAAIKSLPEFIWLGATTNQRYQDLSTAENLAINASFSAIRHSKYMLALEWIEHARCVVWNQTLMLRSPLDQLQSCRPDLAARLQTVSRQLQDISDESSGPLPGLIIQENVSQQRLLLALEYKSLLSQTRKLPGFEDFLQPMKSAGLIRAARYGPVVVVNCHPDGSDALIVIPRQGDVKHLPLPGYTQEKARNAVADLEDSLRRKGLRQRGVKLRDQPLYEERIPGVLLGLWTAVVKPVLEFLGFLNDVSVDSLPHITWCPTGALSFLPLHAAGDYNQPRARVFDYVISSYTPTLTALLASAPNSLPPPRRVLAIGQAKTPGHTPLPGTTQELTCLQAHMQSKVEYTQLIDNKATTAAVLDEMEQHDWVHLACHAHQNVKDPTKSGFFLHDGTLDLASISRRSFKNKGLAFLSACQTATGDEKLPDEAIHLASGMLMAGYPSVIATMWSVVDADAPFVADKVYGQLMKDGKVGNGAAGRALHRAVAELRDKVGEQAFGRWVPYIHIGS
ncbi:hypothetical protein OPQ81_001672 [Rhizoctonia solani]|nr:hypothetical protein OPQ81_001672 [Rhizoctonia solani]